MTYIRRYPGGFLNRPATTTPADAAFLNAVEDELIRVGGHITNADIDAAAAIAKSKLAALSIVDADVSAISASKITPGANGQWIKTTGGAVVWSAIQPSDIGGYPSDATKVLRGDGAWAIPAMVLLDDLVVGPSVLASYDTNARLGGNLPSTYKHIKLIVSAQLDVAGTYTVLQFNGDTAAANYKSGQNAYNGAARADSFSGAGTVGYGYAGFTPGTGESTNWSSWEITIPNYNAAHKHPYFSVGGGAQQGANYNGSFWGHYEQAVALTRIVALGVSGNFVVGSRFSLYGIN